MMQPSTYISTNPTPTYDLRPYWATNWHTGYCWRTFAPILFFFLCLLLLK